MSIRCPACGAPIPAASRSCPQCAVPLEPGSPAVADRIAVMLARLLILLALLVNIVGWVACPKNIDAAIMLGLVNSPLGFILFIVGLIARYRWASLLGLAHFTLPFAMIGLVALFDLGPLRAQPAFLRADAVFLAVVAPLSIIVCFRGPATTVFKQRGLCRKCGYPLSALTEPRCPECGTPFDPKLRAGPPPLRQGPAAGP